MEINMKTFRKKLNWMIGISVVALLFINVGCEKEGPLGPLSLENQSNSMYSELQILSFGPQKSLKKVVRASKFIEKNTGGRIVLNYEYDCGGQEIEVGIKLQILPNAIDEDGEFELSIDDAQFLGELDVLFGPHGTIFSIPAILNIDIEIEDYDPSVSNLHNLDLDIYYDNEQTGQWEFMPSDGVEVQLVCDDGEYELKIRVRNALMSHFSRYAIGEEQ
jgi:hypothetical protein